MNGRLRVDEVDDALLVSAGGAHPALVAVARALAPEAGRLGVVVADPQLVYHPELAHRLRYWVPARFESIRLVAPRAGSADVSGRIPAQYLADRLEADVVAPDGEFVSVPGGVLFVLGLAQSGTGQFWRFRPGRQPLPAERRYPAPDWERDLPTITEFGSPEVVVEEIPAGLWIRWANSVPPDPDDLAYAIAVQPEGPALVVSRPGEQPMRSGDIRRVIDLIPASLHERIIPTPYGDFPLADGELGAVVSAAANRTLRVRTGLSLHLAGRGKQIVAIDADGGPAWAPFAQEVAWRPHGGGRVLSWQAPAAQLLPAGPAQLMLDERWVVEVVEAGLWIRPVERSEGASTVRRLPLTARQCTVVIGVAEADQPVPPWRSVERMLDRLPREAQVRLRIAVQASAGEWFADAVAKGCRRLTGDRRPDVLTASGRLHSWGEPHPPLRPETAERHVPQRPYRDRTDEAGSLLSFVDEIRRTPAWDEMPLPEPEPAPVVPQVVVPPWTDRSHQPETDREEVR